MDTLEFRNHVEKGLAINKKVQFTMEKNEKKIRKNFLKRSNEIARYFFFNDSCLNGLEKMTKRLFLA